MRCHHGSRVKVAMLLSASPVIVWASKQRRGLEQECQARAHCAHQRGQRQVPLRLRQPGAWRRNHSQARKRRKRLRSFHDAAGTGAGVSAVEFQQLE